MNVILKKMCKNDEKENKQNRPKYYSKICDMKLQIWLCLNVNPTRRWPPLFTIAQDKYANSGCPLDLVNHYQLFSLINIIYDRYTP